MKDRLSLTPAALRGAYTMLRGMPPFSSWSLPEPDAVDFRTIRNKDRFGHYVGGTKDPSIQEIGVNPSKHKTLNGLLETVAHEMIHMKLAVTAHRTGLHPNSTRGHGPAFQRLAKQVCSRYGWDLEAF